MKIDANKAKGRFKWDLHLVHGNMQQNQDFSLQNQSLRSQKTSGFFLNVNYESKVYSLLKNIQCVRYF